MTRKTELSHRLLEESDPWSDSNRTIGPQKSGKVAVTRRTPALSSVPRPTETDKAEGRDRDPRMFPALSPLGERVDREGAFTSRRGTGEGVGGSAFSLLNNLSIRDSPYQFAVGLEEVELPELGSRHPLDVLKYPIADCATKASDREENHFHIPIRVSVVYAKDLLPYFGLDHQFLSQLAAQGGFQVFTLSHLASRKFPLHSVSVRMMTLADQDEVALYYDAGGDEDGFLFGHKRTYSSRG